MQSVTEQRRKMVKTRQNVFVTKSYGKNRKMEKCREQ